MNAIKPGVSAPVYISGIKYPSFFNAMNYGGGISQTSLSLALKKSNGEPCKIRRNIVVLEAWVLARIQSLSERNK